MTKETAPHASGEHTAPADAFRFTCDAQFKDAASTRDAKGVREYPVSVVARRGGVVEHWYWGRICHNLDGVRTKEKVALDWCHTNELIGYADSISAKSGQLVLDGKLISIMEDDRADEIGRKGVAGIPFESSIFWDPTTAIVHWLQEGMKEQVNGQSIEGPCYVVDEWDLRGQAICPYGVDSQTKTQFSSAGLPASVSLKVREAAMSANATADSNPTKDAATKTESTATGNATQTTTATADSSKPATTTTTTTTSGATTDNSERTSLKRYMDKFGDAAGARYFADGLTYEQALEKHCDALQGQLKTATDAKAATDAKLASVDRGAEQPTTDYAAPTKDSPQRSKFVKSLPN